jgi:hypothetical protein
MVSDVRPSFPSDQAAIKAVAGFLGIDNPNTLLKWVRRARFSGRNDVHGASSLKRFFFRSHTIVIGSVVTVLGGLALAYSQQFFGLGVSGDSPAPRLIVDQVSLSYGIVPISKTSPSYIAGPFKIDIKLLNTGGQLVAINSARLVIQEFATLQICANQGGFPATGAYPANLPINPRPGRVVNIPISQLVPANGADRFDLLLRAGSLPAAPDNIYLYRFHLYLTYNANDKLLDAGEIAMSYPDAPDDGRYFWSKRLAGDPHSLDFLNDKRYEALVRECDIKDSRTLHSVLSLPGMRPAELIAIPSQLAY